MILWLLNLILCFIVVSVSEKKKGRGLYLRLLGDGDEADRRRWGWPEGGGSMMMDLWTSWYSLSFCHFRVLWWYWTENPFVYSFFLLLFYCILGASVCLTLRMLVLLPSDGILRASRIDMLLFFSSPFASLWVASWNTCCMLRLMPLYAWCLCCLAQWWAFWGLGMF